MRTNRLPGPRSTWLAEGALVIFLLNAVMAASANGATKASPTVTSTLSANSVAVGVSIYDTATLTGGVSPTGRMAYIDYQNADCTGQGDVIGNGTVTGNGDALPSFGVTFSSPGVYSFEAVYTGDSNNNPATSGCELLTVVAASSSVAASTTSSSSTPSSSMTSSSTSSSTAVASSSSTSALVYVAIVVVVVVILLVGLLAMRRRGSKPGGSPAS